MNFMYSFLGYSLQSILSFFVRSMYIRYIGQKYLGLNSVYISMMSLLSFADLGLDTVFVFLLYKPFKEKNYKLINGVLKIYKIFFRIISISVIFIGILLIPFIPYIIGNKSHVTGAYIIYALFVINSSAGYLNSYNRSILIVDQKNYIIQIVSTIFIVLIDLTQIIGIIVNHSPIFYIIIQVIGNICINITVFIWVKKHYRYILRSGVSELNKLEKRTLLHNSIGGVSDKIGTLVVFSSDNILLSMYTNLVIVGMYSNYMVLITIIRTLLSMFISAISPGLGELGTEKNYSKNKNIFLELHFIIGSLSTFIFLCFYIIIDPFLTIWIGKNSVFEIYTNLLIAINLWLSLIRTTAILFITSNGLQGMQKWKALVEAILNLLFTLIFLKIFHMGLDGIMLGTILSSFMVVVWYEPWIVFKKVIPRMNLFSYLKINLPFILFAVLGSFVHTVFYLNLNLDINMSLNILVSCTELILFLIIYIFLYKNNIFYKNVVERLKKILKRA